MYMIQTVQTYQVCLGSFVRENLCISERVVTQCWRRRERISRARWLAVSQRVSKLEMHRIQADKVNTSYIEGEVDHVIAWDIEEE